MSKLMTLKTAEQIIESWDHALEAHHECVIEAGMGAVSMGFDGYDGMSEYRMSHPVPYPADDPEYLEATAVTKMFLDLRVAELHEYGRYGIIFKDDVVVPEYFPYGEPARDEIPF